MITKTDAVVLRVVEYQNSSLIVTLFTRKHGKIAVMARGAKRPKSKTAAYLVPGHILEVVCFVKNTRSVQTLSDVYFSRKLDSLRFDMEKMALTTTVLELSSQLLHENEPNEEVFDFLERFLPWLNDHEEVSRVIFPYVQIRLAQILGVGLQYLDQDGTETSEGYINIESGTLSGEPEGSESVRLTSNQFAFVRESLHSMKSALFKTNFEKNELSSLIEYLDRYFRFHFEGIRPRKSDAIFDQILNH